MMRYQDLLEKNTNDILSNAERTELTQLRTAAELRQHLVDVDDHHCAYCQTTEANTGQPMVVDHIIPEAQGGRRPDHLHGIIAEMLCAGYAVWLLARNCP